MPDVYDEHAAIAGEAAGLRPEQWAGLAHLLRAIARDEREACAKIVETLNGDFERDTGPRTENALRSGIAAAIRNRSN